jgi:hypothetical protein
MDAQQLRGTIAKVEDEAGRDALRELMRRQQRLAEAIQALAGDKLAIVDRIVDLIYEN